MKSLLATETPRDDQLALFAGYDVPGIDRSGPEGQYTGERLWRDRPHIYRAAVELLAEPGVSIRQICRLLHLSDNTLQAVAAREKIPISAHKTFILRNIGHGLRLATERVIETLPAADCKAATIAVGVLTEKLQLLSGEATARLETVAAGNIFDRFAAFTAEIEKTAQAREIGFEAGEMGQKAITEGERGELPGDSEGDGSQSAQREGDLTRLDKVSSDLPLAEAIAADVRADGPGESRLGGRLEEPAGAAGIDGGGVARFRPPPSAHGWMKPLGIL